MGDNFQIEAENDKAVIKMTPVLDMSFATDLLKMLKEVVTIHKNLSLDVCDVERVSTPCIQIILAAANKVEQTGGKFSILNVSSGFERGMTELGLTEHLGKWREN